MNRFFFITLAFFCTHFIYFYFCDKNFCNNMFWNNSLLIFEKFIQSIFSIFTPTLPYKSPFSPPNTRNFEFLLLFSSSVLFCVVQWLLVVGPVLVCGLPTKGHIIQGNWLHFQVPIKYRWLWTRSGALYTTPFLWDLICLETGQVLDINWQSLIPHLKHQCCIYTTWYPWRYLLFMFS